jgi:carboxypeptidase PM20D1
MKKFALTALAVVFALAVVVIVRTLLHRPAPVPRVALPNGPVAVAADVVAQHLAEAIRFQTVSVEPPQSADGAQFEAFLDWIAATYPDAMARLQPRRVGYSLLLTWRGSDAAAAPILLTTHYDVVPVIAGTESRWQQPPFSGAIVNGVIWGRGALDDKSAVVAQLEAANLLVKQGFQPERTVYFSFGHDEELGGNHGAADVVALLRRENVRLAWTLDEGSFLFDDLIPGVNQLFAPINVAEKGIMNLQIIARGQGGHSSLPPPRTAVGSLAAAIVKLEEHPLPGGLDALSARFWDSASRYMPFGSRLVFANRWLFGPLIERRLSESPFGNAMLRTTTAPTMLSGSPKSNVLPIEAVATVNFRLHPRDTSEHVVDFVKRHVTDDAVSVRVDRAVEASPVSSWTAPGFTTVADAVRSVYGAVVVIPGLMVAASDSKHYGKIAENSYRFNPMRVTQDDLTGFHGSNEKLSVETLVRAVQTYAVIIQTGSETEK